MESCMSKGKRVLVELGKSKRYAGIILKLHNNAPKGVTIKPILKVVDESPIVTPQQMQFWEWVSSYYLSPLGDVYKAAFPGGMKKEQTHPQPLPAWRGVKTPSGQLKSATLGELEGGHVGHLSPTQQSAYTSILDYWNSKGNICLLHGVTSSGKTEIYIQLIQKAIEEGKQVLYLLPEIALTTQITNRLKRVFGDALGVYHSKFTDAERVRVYMRQLSSEPFKVILGVRSSVFLPFQNLGMVIVDEEHETSYKQQEPAPRYHARSAAIMLAQQYGAKVLLGTATPSIESYNLAQEGRYGYVLLTQRYADMQLPEIEVVDIARLRFQKRMKGAFSQRLIDEIGGALERGEQIILFQNRRGFSSLIQCKQCGWVPRCQHCDVSLTYHKVRHALTCHYCGAVYELPDHCPECSKPEDAPSKFISIGAGTERIEEQLLQLFPSARISRMDLDTAKTRAQYQRIIDDFSSHQSDILIGTQMVTKGLDFDNVSVVGIIDADTMLNQPDFRSYERTFQMLSQVAGRAGRKGRRGKVILQTRSADSPVIQQVVDNNYEAMFREQCEERRLFHYPPFYRIIYIYVRHRDKDILYHVAEEMGKHLRQAFGESVLGPSSPTVGRVASMYIQQFILKIPPTASISSIRSHLLRVQTKIQSLPYAANINIYYDVDPS